MIMDKEQPEQTIEGVQQTVDSIGMMWRALSSISRDVLPKSPEWFAVMAEGYVDQIRELLDEVDAYITDISKPLAEEAEAPGEERGIQTQAHPDRRLLA